MTTGGQNQSWIGALAIIGAFIAPPALAEVSPWPPTLGLYDDAGYAYYPMETHIFGASRAQANLRTTAAVRGESIPASDVVQARYAGVARKAPVAIRFHAAPRISTRSPMPLPESMIMDPWNIGVFR